MRFSAEGVQIGHVGSAAGMGGIWSVAVHEDGELLSTHSYRKLTETRTAGDPAGKFDCILMSMSVS